MRVHRRASGIENLRGLRQHSRDRTREHIPHARHGHARIAAIAEPRHFARVPDQAGCAFQHDGAAALLAQRGQCREAVGLHLGGTGTEQARGFTGVRRQHPVLHA